VLETRGDLDDLAGRDVGIRERSGFERASCGLIDPVLLGARQHAGLAQRRRLRQLIGSRFGEGAGLDVFVHRASIWTE